MRMRPLGLEIGPTPSFMGMCKDGNGSPSLLNSLFVYVLKLSFKERK